MDKGSEGPQVVNRRTGNVFREKVLGGGLMHLAYRSRLHPLLRATLFKTGLLSRILGYFTEMSVSRRQIERTIRDLDIDASEFAEPVESFENFHQFFVRNLKKDARPFDSDPLVFSSPADSRLTVFSRLEDSTLVPLKGAAFSLEELTRRSDLTNFSGGSALVFRLCPADYHRYHYPCDGRVLESWEISGRYDSVHPTALEMKLPVFTENKRSLSILNLKNFGPCLFIEVGAFGVGGIIQTHSESIFRKLDEKGYFRYGASTLILVTEKNRLTIDPDLIENSAKGMETLVQAGESLGNVSRTR